MSDFLSIDKMMKLFKGWSSQTHMMKNKPIKEGFKVWTVSCLVNGFIYQFIPSRKLEGEKTYDVVNDTVDALPWIDVHEEDEDTNIFFVINYHFPCKR